MNPLVTRCLSLRLSRPFFSAKRTLHCGFAATSFPRSGLFISALVALALALPAQAATDADFFGVCEHFCHQTNVRDNRHRLMTLMARDGVGWVRADFPWVMIEPTQGNWSWSNTDAVMATAAERGVKVLPILCYGCAYTGHDAVGSRFVSAEELDAWSTYVSNVVTRYRSQFTAVEVWNEPDNSTFWNGTTAEYVAILQRAYTTVKAIDPSITVVLGGLTARATDFLSSLYSAGARNYFDVMAFHPYIQPHSPSETWETGGVLGFGTTKHSFSRRIDAMRSVMSDNGDGSKPIWLTEVGWPTTGNSSVSEANQALYTTNAMAIAKSKGIGKYFVYELMAEEYDNDCERHFGILHNPGSNLSFKPAWGAVRDYIYGETHNGAIDPYGSHVYLACGDHYWCHDNGNTVSFAAAGFWSDNAAPSSGKDYIVDLGAHHDMALYTPTNANGSATFAGRSLTLGRVGGRAGWMFHDGAGSTVTVNNLTLNNGRLMPYGGTGAAGQTLAGSITVASPRSAPYTIEAWATVRDYTVAAPISGGSGTAIRGTAASGATLNLKFTGSSSGFSGATIFDGPRVTGSFASASLAGSGAVILTNGATFKAAANNLTLRTRPLRADGATAGVINVPSGLTFTLACPLAGTFTKTGAGTLILDGNGLSGNGTVNVAEGTVSIDAASAARLGTVADGVTVLYRVADGESGFITVPAGRTYILEGVVTGDFTMLGPGTLVLDLDHVGGDGGGIDVAGGTVPCDIDTVKYISGVTGGTLLYRTGDADGILDSAQEIALFTSDDPVSGTIAFADAEAGLGWESDVVDEPASGGRVSVSLVVRALPRTVVGSDSFEGYARGAEAKTLAGWSGEGLVTVGTPDIGNPPGVPLPDATHTNALTLDYEATRIYVNAFARDNQSIDMLVQVFRQDGSTDWQTNYIAEDTASGAQLRLSFDEDGHPWLLHGNATGTGLVWSQLKNTAGAAAGAQVRVTPAYANGSWLRVSFDIDYNTSPTAAYAQVRIEGSCMLASDGFLTPGGVDLGGSWLRLPAAAVSARKVSSVTVVGANAVDDLVHCYHAAGTDPDFAPFGGTDLGGIPRSWFDGNGIPRDPSSDPDGDGFVNIREWRRGTDPADIGSHPPHPATLIVR